MKRALGTLDIVETVSPRVMRWSESDVELMRDGIRQLEAVLENARAELHVAESRLRAQAC